MRAALLGRPAYGWRHQPPRGRVVNTRRRERKIARRWPAAVNADACPYYHQAWARYCVRVLDHRPHAPREKLSSGGPGAPQRPPGAYAVRIVKSRKG